MAGFFICSSKYVPNFFTVEPSPKPVELKDLNLPKGKNFVVTWYGAMKRYRNEGEVPRLVFWFLELDRYGLLGGMSIQIELAMSYLGQLRIGSVWRDGQSTEQLQFTKREIRCVYSQQHWFSTTSASEHHRNHSQWLIPLEDYRLHYGKSDRSRLLRFQSEAQSFLIPCQEYFARCYARAEEINRILITYDKDEIRKRLLLEEPIEIAAEEWQVWLPREATKWDSVLLAYLRHEHSSWLNVMRIKAAYDQQLFGTGQTSTRNGLAFVPVGPWFLGDAQLEVEGIQLSTGDFLGLRITGYSLPDVNKIVGLRDLRETPNDGEIGAFPVPRLSVIQFGEEATAPATERSAPDRDTDIHQIHDPAIRLMGAQPRLHIKQVPRETKGTNRVPPSKSDASSAGETSGTGKGLARARFMSAMSLDSQSAVEDLWAALRYLQNQNKALLQELICFEAKSGLAIKPADGLSYVELPWVKEDTPTQQRSQQLWLHKDTLPSRRGVCIVRVKTPLMIGYIFELQRGFVKRTVEETQVQVEESYCGLAIAPPPDTEIKVWLREVMESIVRCRGIMSNVLEHIDHMYGGDYKRSPKSDGATPGLATAIRALKRLGIRDLEPCTPCTELLHNRLTQLLPSSFRQ